MRMRGECGRGSRPSPPTPASTLLEPYLHSREQDFAPDNPFVVQYAVVHHYRSLGWVIKSGVKFCADYLLYKRGPVFSHAEYVLASFKLKYALCRTNLFCEGSRSS